MVWWIKILFNHRLFTNTFNFDLRSITFNMSLWHLQYPLKRLLQQSNKQSNKVIKCFYYREVGILTCNNKSKLSDITTFNMVNTLNTYRVDTQNERRPKANTDPTTISNYKGFTINDYAERKYCNIRFPQPSQCDKKSFPSPIRDCNTSNSIKRSQLNIVA